MEKITGKNTVTLQSLLPDHGDLWFWTLYYYLARNFESSELQKDNQAML